MCRVASCGAGGSCGCGCVLCGSVVCGCVGRPLQKGSHIYACILCERIHYVTHILFTRGDPVNRTANHKHYTGSYKPLALPPAEAATHNMQEA